MKRILVAALVLTAGAAIILLLMREDGAPLPSATSLATYGFAVWPEDTVKEGLATCDRSEPWQRDPQETARRFAATVLKYPKPEVAGGRPVDNHVSYLINSRRMGGLSLGSSLDLRRFGHCWFVVGGEPREGDLGATIAFLRRADSTHLLLSHPYGIPHAEVGFGTWDTEIDGGRNQVRIELPDVDPDATGHALFTSPDERGTSEQVGAETLGVIPRDSGRPARGLRPSEVVDNPRVCRIESSPFHSARAVIRHLYAWTFDALLEQVKGYPTYRRKAFEQIDGDLWRLVVDDAELHAVVPEIAGRCFKLVSMAPKGVPPIRSLRIAPRSVTLELRWGDADAALVQFGVGFDGRGGTLRRVDEPIMFQRKAPPQPAGVPTYALVVLYKDEHIVSAQYGLYTNT